MEAFRYSTLFNTVHDQHEPTVDIGRGAHFSILSTAQWLDMQLIPMARAVVQRIAIIWDEGHDTRIIPMLEAALINGIISPVLFVGERKGSVTLMLDMGSPLIKDPEFIQAWQKICYGPDDDHWSLTIIGWGENTHPLIHDEFHKAVAYLEMIDAQFKLGLWEYKYQCVLRDYWVSILDKSPGLEGLDRPH